MLYSGDSKLKPNKGFQYFLLTAFSALLVGAGALFVHNRGMLDDLRAERVSSESIIHERNFALQEIRIVKNKLRASDELNQARIDSLADLSSQLVKALKTNKSLQQKVKEAEEQQSTVSAFQTLKFEQDQAFQQLEKRSGDLQSQNQHLKHNLLSVEQENSRLSTQLDEYVNKAILFDVEARRSLTGKLTVHARNTRAIHVEFTIAKGTLEPNSKLYVTLTDIQQGKGIPGKELPITLSLDGENMTIQPAALAKWEGKGAADRMELGFELDKKLQKGIYQVDVYSDSRYLGGSRLRLQ